MNNSEPTYKISFTLHEGPNYKLGFSSWNYVDVSFNFLDPLKREIKISYNDISDGTDISTTYTYFKFYGKQENLGLIYGDVEYVKDVVILKYNIFRDDVITAVIDANPSFYKSSIYKVPYRYKLKEQTTFNYIYELNTQHPYVSDSEFQYADVNKTTYSVGNDLNYNTKIYIKLDEHPYGFSDPESSANIYGEYNPLTDARINRLHSNTPLNQKVGQVFYDDIVYNKHTERWFEFFIRTDYSKDYNYIIERYKKAIYSRPFLVIPSLRGVARFDIPNIYGIVPSQTLKKRNDIATLKYVEWFLDLRENKNPYRDWKQSHLIVEPGLFIGTEVFSVDESANDYYYLNGQFLTPKHKTHIKPYEYTLQIPEIGIDHHFQFYQPVSVPIQGQGTVASNIDYATNAINKIGALVGSAGNIFIGITGNNPYALSRGISTGVSAISGLVDWHGGLNNNFGKREGAVKQDTIYKVIPESFICYFKSYKDVSVFNGKYVKQIDLLKGIETPIIEIVE